MTERDEKITTHLREVFFNNELKANRFSALLMFVLGILYAFFGTLNAFGIYEPNSPGNFKVYYLVGTLFIAGFVVSKIFKAKWVKWVLLILFIVSNSLLRVFFYVFASIAFTVPIFLSTCYYNKKFTRFISIITWVFFVITLVVYASDTLDHESLSNLFFVSILPQTVLIVVFEIIGTRVAVFGREMIVKRSLVAAKVSAMEADISMASKIQNSVLPPNQFFSANGNFSLKASMTPAKEVAGDFFDYFMLNENQLVIMMADVSDKGLPAAMFMMSARSSIRYAVEKTQDIVGAMNIANDYLLQNNTRGMFVTIWLGIVDVRTGVGKFVNAGHTFPLLKHQDNSVEFLENEPEPFLGVFEGLKFSSHLLRFLPGDSLLLYTDGVTDAMDKNEKFFGLEHLLEVARMTSNTSESLCDGVVNSVKIFSEGRDLFDDVTVLALTCNSVECETIEKVFEVDSKTEKIEEIVSAVNELLSARKCPEDTRRQIDVIVDEVCCNIVDYAYNGKLGQMRICCSVGGNFIKIVFEDEGAEFNPLESQTPLSDDEPNVGGLGIHLVRSLVDDMKYERLDGKNVFSVEKVWNV